MEQARHPRGWPRRNTGVGAERPPLIAGFSWSRNETTFSVALLRSVTLLEIPDIGARAGSTSDRAPSIIKQPRRDLQQLRSGHGAGRVCPSRLFLLRRCPCGGPTAAARRRLRNVYLGRCTMFAPGTLRTARLFGCPERMEDALAEGPSTPLGWGVLVWRLALRGISRKAV
jgi:hypothetical protein